MRFAAVNVPKQQPKLAPAAELIRRIVAGEAAMPGPPAPARLQDLPADLDQRVRLVGEW